MKCKPSAGGTLHIAGLLTFPSAQTLTLIQRNTEDASIVHCSRAGSGLFVKTVKSQD
jgi:hypothetical protein